MKKENWIWMPHAAHFICGHSCRFKLATYVGGYIVSTVGEYDPDSKIRDAYGEHGEQRKKFHEIGCQRLYETMVFKAKKSKDRCCPYVCIVDGGELDFAAYNDPKSAYKGHLRLCNKWAKKDLNHDARG